MWWNVPSVVCCGKTSVAYEIHFGLNGHNWRSSGNTSNSKAVRDTFVIRPITGYQLTTFSLGQVLNTWLCGVCLLCGECVFCTLWGGVVVSRKRAMCWRQWLARPAGSGHYMPACVCLLVSVFLRVHMQQFDQCDKGRVVVYTLVLTRCADHILSAYGPLPTSFSLHTIQTPSSPFPLHLTPNSKLCLFVTHDVSCFFSPLLFLLLKAGWGTLLLF